MRRRHLLTGRFEKEPTREEILLALKKCPDMVLSGGIDSTHQIITISDVINYIEQT